MKIIATLAFLFSIFQTSVFAQLSTSSSVGLSYIIPASNTGDHYDSGFGVIGTSNIQIIPLLGIAVTGSYNNLKSKEISIDGSGNVMDGEDMNIYGITAGPYVKLALFDIGVKGGYYFGDISEWAVLPFVQLILWKLTVGAEYKTTSDTKWYAIYLNYNF